MNRHVTAFKQLLTHTDLNTFCQADAEEAMKHLVSDIAIFGVITGGVVSEHAGAANFTVDITGPCVAYNQAGERCYMGVAQVLNCAVDYLGVATVPTTPTHHRWISVHLRFARALSDLKMDGNDPPVPYYWTQAESFELRVVSGLSGVGPARPAKPSDAILLCDIDLVQGMASIVNANIDTTRRDGFSWLPAGVVTVDDSAWTKIDPAANVQTALDNVDTMLIDRNGTGEITEASLVPSVDGGLTLGSSPKRVNVFAGAINVNGAITIAAANEHLFYRRFARLDLALTEAAPAIAAGIDFSVGSSPQAGMYLLDEVAADDTGGGYVHVACDGVRIFAAYPSAATPKVIAYHRVAGVWTELWSITPAAAPLCIACDGARVFYGINRTGAANVYMVNAVTGAAIDDDTLPGTRKPYNLACDGATLAIGTRDATNVSVIESTYTASVITPGSELQWGLVATPAQINSLAIARFGTAFLGDTMIIAGGKGGGAGALDNLQLMAGGILLAGKTGGEVHGVKCDGRRIFLAHDSYEVVTGSTIDSYCHCRSINAEKVLWYGPASGVDASQGCSFDGHRLFVGVGAKLASGDMVVFGVDANHGGVIERECYISDVEILGACDGAQLVCQDRSGGAGDDHLGVIPVAHGPRRFVRTADTDINRTPGFCLAQPAE
jgi:hypothetical protein